MKLPACLACVCLMALPVGAQQRTYTIHDIFAEPGLTGYAPESVEWSPDGKRITFLEHHETSEFADLYSVDVATGTRAVLVAGDILAGAATPLSKLKNERERERRARYAVSTYHWSPKGDLLLYNSSNQLFVFDPRTRQTHPITTEAGDKDDPKMSPDERWVSYVTAGDLNYVPAAGGKARPVATYEDQVLHGGMDWVYPEELELRTGYEWSPDSQRIAYMQFDERPVHAFPLVDYIPHLATVDEERYPKAGDPNPLVSCVIIEPKNGHSVRVPLAGTPDTYLARIGWLPDSKSLYAIVIDRAQKHEQIFLVDPHNGRPRLLLTETNPYWIDLRDDLEFLKTGDRFIFGSDRDGWRHLYLFDMSGRLIHQLTTGPWHDTYKSVDEKGGWVYYTAAARTPLETDLYRVSLNGGAPQRLTAENGNHSITMSPDNMHYIDVYSTVTRAPEMTLRSVSGGPVRVIHPAKDLSGFTFQKPEFFTIPAADGHTQLYATMTRPPNFEAGHKYPVIMSQYGGPAAQTVSNNWGSSTFFYDQLLARDGFILFEVDNRAAGYFSRTQQALIQHHFGRVELQDQLAAVRWLKSQPYVDPDRIGIWGWSFGGYMTTYQLTNAPGVWRAGIAVAPVTEWPDYDSIYTERYMGMPQENTQGYEESASTTHVDRFRDHLLLVHGTGDDNVHFQNSLQFIQSMIEHGKQLELMVYPRKTHGIAGTDARTHLFTLMEDFWKRRLEPQR